MIRIRLKQLLDEKAFKERRRITLNDVAEATGISRPTLTRIANIAGYNTNTDTVDALCKYFGCEPSDLLQFLANE
jgi:putative transcriptional regulator